MIIVFIKTFLKQHLSAKSISTLRYFKNSFKGVVRSFLYISDTKLSHSVNISDTSLQKIEEIQFDSIFKTLKSQIDNPSVKTVSFDIFDTLLFRPFYKPTDLFDYIEKVSGKTGFAKARINAEITARQLTIQEEITFDQIYEQISPFYKDLQTVELDYEKKFLIPRSIGKKLYEYAKFKGKNVIAISDMYLDTACIRNLLREKGFNEFSDIFVSSDLKKTKATGNLFKFVLEKLQCRESEILHLGDNLHSDFDIPLGLGLRAHHIPTEFDFFASRKKNQWVVKNYLENPTLLNSILLGLALKYSTKNSDEISKIAYNLGGILSLSYVKFIHEITEKQSYDCLFFVARDGYMLKNIYQKIYNKFPSFYVYANRLLYINCTLNYDNDSEKLQALLKSLKDSGVNIKISSIFSKNKKIASTYQTELKSFAEKNLQHYLDFLKNKSISGKQILVIDMTSLSFTAYRFMKFIYGDCCKGCVFSCIPGKKPSFDYFEFADRNLKSRQYSLITISEFLLSAPEMTAKGFDANGHLIMAKDSGHINQYKKIMQGINDFVDDYCNLFHLSLLPLTFNTWLEIAEKFYKYADNETLDYLNQVNLEDLNSDLQLGEVIRNWRKEWN